MVDSNPRLEASTKVTLFNDNADTTTFKPKLMPNPTAKSSLTITQNIPPPPPPRANSSMKSRLLDIEDSTPSTTNLTPSKITLSTAVSISSKTPPPLPKSRKPDLPPRAIGSVSSTKLQETRPDLQDITNVKDLLDMDSDSTSDETKTDIQLGENIIIDSKEDLEIESKNDSKIRSTNKKIPPLIPAKKPQLESLKIDSWKPLHPQ